MHFRCEGEPSGAAVPLRKRIDVLKVLTFVLGDLGAEDGDVARRMDKVFQERRATAVQSANKNVAGESAAWSGGSDDWKPGGSQRSKNHPSGSRYRRPHPKPLSRGVASAQCAAGRDRGGAPNRICLEVAPRRGFEPLLPT